MAETLMERTRRLVNESELTLPKLYLEMRNAGIDVSFYWLRKFKQGRIKDPSVNTVEALYTFLTGRDLFGEPVEYSGKVEVVLAERG